MKLLNNLTSNQLTANFHDAELYSDAHRRNAFVHTTWHAPGGEVVLQVSNMLNPSVEGDEDWAELDSTPAKAGHLFGPWVWVRFKRASAAAGSATYVNLVSLQYLAS